MFGRSKEIEALRVKVLEQELIERTSRAEAAKADAALAMSKVRPSRFAPVTMVYNGLEWECRLQSNDNPRNELVGTGDTPEKATVAFDYKWYGLTEPT